MNARLMLLTLSLLAALVFLLWEQNGVQKTETHTKWPEATQQILWQSRGGLPRYWLALLTTSAFAKWLESLL